MTIRLGPLALYIRRDGVVLLCAGSRFLHYMPGKGWQAGRKVNIIV